MTYGMCLDFVCTKVGEVKTVTSKKTGKQYKLREYDFIDVDSYDENHVDGNEVNKINDYAIFADANGNIRDLKVGETYTFELAKFYDRTTRSEKEIFRLV